jgi:hypothetical protein
VPRPELVPAAVGFSSHSGWAAAVCLAAPAGRPVVISRSRVLLTSAPLPCEPYHDAKRREDQAEKIIVAAVDEARTLAVEAIRGMRASIVADGYELVASGVVLGGGRPGRSLAQAMSTHAAMHGAEGWLFREALLEAARQCELTTTGVAEVDLGARVAAALSSSDGNAGALVQQIGRDLGPPWRRDQKAAAMAAIVALNSAR